MTEGVYRAIVRDNRDPGSLGRLKVSIPAISGDSPTDWIWPVVSGGYIVKPDPGDQVWVLFEAGDEDNPVWLGMTKVTKTGVNDLTKGYATLIQRVEALEDKVITLQGQVSSLLGALHTH